MQEKKKSIITNKNNDSIKSVLQNDQVRYQRKGYGLFMACVIWVAYFTFAPKILKYLWNDYVSLFSDLRQMQAMTIVFYPLFFYLLGNLMMWFIYNRKIQFFENYRIWPNKQWDWEKDPKTWYDITIRKALKQHLINTFLVVGPAVLFDTYVIGPKCQWKLEDFPEVTTIIFHIFLMMLAEDASFYVGHRLLHTPYLYKKIHKIHHEFTNTTAIASAYAHPIEYLIGNSIPTSLGFMLLGHRVHFATHMLWLIIRVFETIDGHCGYEFSWSPYRLIPLSGSSEYHNYHHSHNVGTFGSFFTIWDTVFGTNKDYYIYKAQKEKKEQEIMTKVE